MVDYEVVRELIYENGIVLSDDSNGILILGDDPEDDIFNYKSTKMDYIVDVSGEASYYRAFQYLTKLNAGGVALLWFDKSHTSIVRFLMVLSEITNYHIEVNAGRYITIIRMENKI